MLIEYMERAMRAAGVDTIWSSASLAGRHGEDRVVAECRPWPCSAADLDLQTLNYDSLLAAAAPGWRQQGQQPPAYHLFAVFDGHNGPEAAEFAQQSIAAIIDTYLPPLGCPQTTALLEGAAELAAEVQAALALSFLELQRQFAAAGCLGGCTATVVVQVGRLVTVGSVGSSRCMLDTGSAEVLALSEDHRVAANLRERQRLLAAGCHLAAVDASGLGPAATPCRGVGALRLWPGGLTLSRSIGDFRIGEGVLPLPHIKQVLLPPSGGRLVLASDSVWSLAGLGLMESMRLVPVTTAARHVVRSVAGSRVDASIIVADVAPAGTSFQAACRRQQGSGTAAGKAAAAGRLARGLRSGGTAVLRALGIGRCSQRGRYPQPLQPEAGGGGQTAAAAAKLADVDTADLLGLMPAAGSTKLQHGSPAASLARSSWQGIRVAAGADASAAMMDAAAAVAAATQAAAAAGQLHNSAGQQRQQQREQQERVGQVAAWFTDRVAAEMHGMLAGAGYIWHQARSRSQAAAAGPAGGAKLHDAACQPLASPAWQEAAAAAGGAEAGVAPTPCAPGPQPRQPEAAAGHTGSSLQQRTSPAGMSAYGSGGLGSIDERTATCDEEQQPMQQSSRPPQGLGASDCSTGTAPSKGPTVRPIACPPLRRSHSSSSATSSSSSGSSGGGSGPTGGPASLSRSSSMRSVVAPATPHAGLVAKPQPLRWHSSGASADDRWLMSYNLAASMFTRGGSGYRARPKQATPDSLDSWAGSSASAAEKLLHRRSQSLGLLHGSS